MTINSIMTGGEQLIEIDKIYNMDCLEGMKQIEDNSIDLIVTDPPYNTGMQKNDNAAWLRYFFNDKYTNEEYQKLVDIACKEMYRILKHDKLGYLFTNFKQLGRWMITLQKTGFIVKNVIVWDKQIHG